jgi:SAM-dependent methyltransferase
VKAEKIVSILRDVWSDRLAESRCLDLGCGIGVIANQLRLSARMVVAMDSEWDLISRTSSELARLQGDGSRLPFNDATFDLMTCAQVYEHVADPVQLVAEIARVLKPGGICYFSGPNRLWPYEYHYQTWLVHWLPDRWLTKALSFLRRDHLPKVTLYNYWQLRKLWGDFVVRDYTVRLVRAPDRFPGADAPRWMRLIPSSVLNMVTFAVPNVNWVLRKPVVEE